MCLSVILYHGIEDKKGCGKLRTNRGDKKLVRMTSSEKYLYKKSPTLKVIFQRKNPLHGSLQNINNKNHNLNNFDFSFPNTSSMKKIPNIGYSV